MIKLHDNVIPFGNMNVAVLPDEDKMNQIYCDLMALRDHLQNRKLFSKKAINQVIEILDYDVHHQISEGMIE